tara:strand:- start:486 stop:1274 length:789 start_codon:yes stop_codon:yes gene_type:complete
MLVDSHCHLDYHERDGDIDDVLARARKSDIGTIVTICTKISEAKSVQGLAARYDNVWCTVGVHPHEASLECQKNPSELIKLAECEEVIGIGESGLDYYYENASRDDQEQSFRTHIAAARSTGLPIVIHSRNADEDCAHILKDEMQNGYFCGVMHCFSSGPSLAQTALELGLYISVSGIITFKKSEELRNIVADVPLERLLVETDAPYLAPEPYRGKRNEPSYVSHTANTLADLKKVDPKILASTTTNNFFSLFSRAQAPVSL